MCVFIMCEMDAHGEENALRLRLRCIEDISLRVIDEIGGG